MIEMTLYGRGGQGGVTLAKLIATAYFLLGKYSQAFGLYAAERSGAPVQAFVRVDDEPITNFNQIRRPDHVVVLDPTLISRSVLTGLADEGWIVLNTPRGPKAWNELFPGRRVATIDATEIAVRNGLGTAAVPIVNSTMMGAIGRVLELSPAEITAALDEVGFVGSNLAAAEEAYRLVVMTSVPGSVEHPAPLPPPPSIESLLSQNVGGLPKLRTGSWATRIPTQRTLTPPCNHVCPAGNDVQLFIHSVAGEDYTGALRTLLETSPLPGVCGRVCPAPCMDACNRRTFDEGVNVRELERWVADHGEWPEPTSPFRLERVAIVGSGPAGLSASYHLARLGYHVSLFEASDELGGVLRNGIPDYRLPKDILDREIGFILLHGVTAYTDARIDRSALADLRKHYQAVFVATGLQHAQSLKIGTGRAVTQGIDFLDQVHRGDISVRGERVIVIGGGNTAIDAARSALRLGATDVRIVYRRSRAEMPAISEEIEAALAEGIQLDELVAPERLDERTLTCTRMTLGEPDESGRRRPVPMEGEDARVAFECDRVILALGQSADLSIMESASDADDTLLAPVFVGGDFGRNEGTVAAAIGSGRFAAFSIHNELTGEDRFPAEGPPVATADVIRPRLFTNEPQQHSAELPLEIRTRTFAEVHTGLSDSGGRTAAVLEAQRCFSCGVCNECNRCIDYCPEGILKRDGNGYRFDYEYCKGCGLCAAECPRGVITLEQIQV